VSFPAGKDGDKFINLAYGEEQEANGREYRIADPRRLAEALKNGQDRRDVGQAVKVKGAAMKSTTPSWGNCSEQVTS
jgi:hypothetical protein